MKSWKLALPAAVLTAGLFAGPILAAQDDPWLSSYKLEAAGQYAQAAQPLESIAKTNDLAQVRLGYLLYLQARYPDAIRAYQRAQEMNSQSYDAVLGITLALLAQGRWADAATQAKSVLSNAPGNYVAHLRLLVAEEGLKDWKTMSAHAEELAKHYPGDATIWVYNARAAAWLGNNTRAAEAYRRVLQIVPGHLEAAKFISR